MSALNRPAWAVFGLLFRPWMSRHIRVHIAGVPALPAGRPALLVANHESWWDGFLLREAHRHLRPRGGFHAVMLADELRKRPPLALLGALGVQPGSFPSTRALLGRVRRMGLEEPDMTLAYFPQGRIEPGGVRPLSFRRGVEAVAAALAPVWVLPIGIRVLPGRSHRMEAYLSVGEPAFVTRRGEVTAAALEADVAREMDAIRHFVELHGENAADLWSGQRGPVRPPGTPAIENGDTRGAERG